MPTGDTCSFLSLERGESMFATGSLVAGWLLIEVRGAWGEDAIGASALGPHLPPRWKDGLAARGIRAVCVRSPRREAEPGVRLFTCIARRPGASQAPSLWTRDVGSLSDVAGAVSELTLQRSPGEGWARTDERVALVCTNGRHDQCCAVLGRPLVRALQESPWADRVWECSHIGGDRFAPNLVVLPDSLYFGRVDPASAPALLAGLDAGRIDLTRFRGRTSYSLAEQAVEHFVRVELGIDAVDGAVVDGRADDGSFRVRLRDREVHVVVRRHMVSVADRLTCRGRPDQLVPAFTLESIR
jgi:hypothetical protein